MVLHFTINFSTQWGEKIYIYGNHNQLGNNNHKSAVLLEYINATQWAISIPFEDEKNEIISYSYFVKAEDGLIKFHAITFTINFLECIAQRVFISDTWVDTNNGNTVYLKKPFSQVFFNKKLQPAKIENHNIKFFVAAPNLQPHQSLILVGHISETITWDETNPIVLKNIDGIKYYIELNVPNHCTINYKYAIKDKNTQTVIYENNENRVVQKFSYQIINDGIANFEYKQFKAAGVAIPVFSLKSNQSFGVGEFADLKILATWCNQVDLQLIQLLPINDTIVSKTNSDSYPYSAISSFALHPIYINLKEVGKLDTKHILQQQYFDTQKALNEKEILDFENTLKFKLNYLKAIYISNAGAFKNDSKYISFFNENKYWLVYYAAFCYLRDKYGTANYSDWEDYSTITEVKIEALIAQSFKAKSEIEFWYFVQYHLHIQLQDAVTFAHQLNVVIKGDLPIGINKNSCDVWQFPQLFNLEMQAGAPPDDFAVNGQNWGFPTYNWQAMEAEGYQWWKNRFAKMGDYFDAFRIDHILGFFRIWSIPNHAIDGILGHFDPALPYSKHDMENEGLYFDEERFTNPYFTESYLTQLFGTNANTLLDVFFEEKYQSYTLKNEFASQVNLKAFLNKNRNQFDKIISEKLINCMNNVLFFRDAKNEETFHPNISLKNTPSYDLLSPQQQLVLSKIHEQYFYNRHNDFWKKEALLKLPILQATTNMLICGEDLGMVPDGVNEVMQELSLLSLEVQRMPKLTTVAYTDLAQVNYLSVSTPSTHDMSTIRGWWLEMDTNVKQHYYNYYLGHFGTAPQYAETWLIQEIIDKHLQSNSMWAIFQIQDLLAINNQYKNEDIEIERINNPARGDQYWSYRMHITLNNLLEATDLNSQLKLMIKNSNRCN
jgi:4-alpha-glucanotransferase